MLRITFKRLCVFFLLAALAAGALWVLRVSLLTGIARVLVHQSSELESFDAVVILPGSVPDRALEAVELFREGRASRVLLLNGELSERDRLVRQMGISWPTHGEVNHQILIRKGVPETGIIEVPPGSRSTREDALSVTALAEREGVKSLAVVTCKFHSYRAYRVFQDTFRGTGITVGVVPSRFCEYSAGNWWRDRDQTWDTLIEWVKLIAYFLGRT